MSSELPGDGMRVFSELHTKEKKYRIAGLQAMCMAFLTS